MGQMLKKKKHKCVSGTHVENSTNLRQMLKEHKCVPGTDVEKNTNLHLGQC